ATGSYASRSSCHIIAALLETTGLPRSCSNAAKTAIVGMLVPVRKTASAFGHRPIAPGAFCGLVIDVSNDLQIVEANDVKTMCPRCALPQDGSKRGGIFAV